MDLRLPTLAIANESVTYGKDQAHEPLNSATAAGLVLRPAFAGQFLITCLKIDEQDFKASIRQYAESPVSKAICLHSSPPTKRGYKGKKKLLRVGRKKLRVKLETGALSLEFS